VAKFPPGCLTAFVVEFQRVNQKKEAVVARQAKQFNQLPPTPGVQRVAFKPMAVPPPDWWAEALIPLE
jgi:hypothetical protein